MERKIGATAASAKSKVAMPASAADKEAIRHAVEQAKTKPAPATTPAKEASTQTSAQSSASCVPCTQPDYAKTIQDLTDTLKHVQADFENHVKQSEKRSAQQCEHASARVLMKVLSIVDDFERALKTLEEAKIDAKLLEGMRMVNKNIHGVLEAEGVRPIECVGKMLDPFKHEVLRRVKKDGVKDDIVIEEHVKGYMLKDKVLRFAKVTVAHNGE